MRTLSPPAGPVPAFENKSRTCDTMIQCLAVRIVRCFVLHTHTHSSLLCICIYYIIIVRVVLYRIPYYTISNTEQDNKQHARLLDQLPGRFIQKKRSSSLAFSVLLQDTIIWPTCISVYLHSFKFQYTRPSSISVYAYLPKISKFQDAFTYEAILYRVTRHSHICNTASSQSRTIYRDILCII